jgi:putative transposase
MPEHVHLIVLPKKVDYNISWFLKQVKQSVSRRAKAWLRENDPQWYSKLTICRDGKKKAFRFWQAGGGYDRNLANAMTLHTMIQYIHNNPVRRGLVSAPTAWQWSSAAWYEEKRNGPLAIDEIVW